MLISRGYSLDEISEAMSQNTGLIPHLVDFNSDDIEDFTKSKEDFSQYKLLSTKWRVPFMYYRLTPQKAQLIQELRFKLAHVSMW